MSLFLPYGTAKAGNGGRGSEADGLPPKFFRVQSILSLDLDCALIVCFPGRIIQERQKDVWLLQQPAAKKKGLDFPALAVL